MENVKKYKARFHLPGLFEFFEFYKEFLPVFYEHREYFYDWVEIASLYGAPANCVWSGGRFGYGVINSEDVLELLGGYNISARLTFSNSLLEEKHLLDEKCNDLCALLEARNKMAEGRENGVIVHSELLLRYLQRKFPELYFVSSTTKVLTAYDDFYNELKREEFHYVVPDFRLNKQFDKLYLMENSEKEKVEFLCNECCYIGCKDRKACYENVSRQILDDHIPDYLCKAPSGKEGYRFSKAMKNPGFISIEDIKTRYLPNGFTNFKIEGRSLGTALILEILLYYMAKPEYHIHIREMLYLDNMLDLF